MQLIGIAHKLACLLLGGDKTAGSINSVMCSTISMLVAGW